jgi:transcriptional regulator with GAF, ATPase, and Fis domain
MASEQRSSAVSLVPVKEGSTSLINKVRRLPRLAGVAQEIGLDLARDLEELQWEKLAEGTPCPHCAERNVPHSRASRLIEKLRRLEGLADEIRGIVAAVNAEVDRRTSGGFAPVSNQADLRSLVDAYERRLIVQALEVAGMKQTTAASLLGVRTTTLNEKLKRLGLRGRLLPKSETAIG